MNKNVVLSCAVLAALVFTGCESTGVSSRITEKSAVFAAMTPEQQKNLKEGAVEVGYTADMVYIALGKPSKVKSKESPDGLVEMWTYNNYYPTVTAVELMANSPAGNGKYNSVNVGSNAPSLAGGPQEGAGLSSTTQSGPSTGYGFADMPSDTLYVLLLNGKVFEMKLQSTSGEMTI